MIQNLGNYHPAVDAALAELKQEDVITRIWACDHTLWRPEPTEIANRLGWLDIAERMKKELHSIASMVQEVQADGYTHAMLLGMGGSSLAPEVFRKTLGVKPGYLDLAVLDSTDPGAVLAHADRLNPGKTLFIVSTKSGGTVETSSLFKFFYNQVANAVGADRAGAHFIAITDPGSSLVALADRHSFRATFLNDPNIGGRYSALSFFGLVPAALIGVDLATLLDRATAATQSDIGGRLGAVIGALAREGRDKVTFFTSPQLASFGDWVEQLIAESTGKEDKGVLPVVGEPIAAPRTYGQDRLFICLYLKGDNALDAELKALETAGHPTLRLQLNDLCDLGAQFFIWELATAIASHFLQINPFDQPNVESAKVLARKMVAAYTETGALPASESALLNADTLRRFMAQAQPSDYVALQAYVQPTPGTDAALNALRLWLRDEYKLATTVGYGPRFLHSTGQLHKGDRGNGLFIQLTADNAHDAPIPDAAGEPESTMGFGVLEMAQALGDYQALVDAKRRVTRFHLSQNVVGELKRVVTELA
ncbi:MAG: glucose-6-phosphate isomerase [Anaerolineae bacterium]|nr:glucose-6-phosphate isomerase [Anaerolineae bacterium]